MLDFSSLLAGFQPDFGSPMTVRTPTFAQANANAPQLQAPHQSPFASIGASLMRSGQGGGSPETTAGLSAYHPIYTPIFQQMMANYLGQL